MEIARFLRKNRKQNKQKYCYTLQLKGCAHYSLLVHLFKFLAGTQISSRSIVNVNSKHANQKIYPALLKKQSIKSSTTKSCCSLYHYLQSAKNSANLLLLQKNLLCDVIVLKTQFRNTYSNFGR